MGRASEASLRRMLNIDRKGINKDGSGIQRGEGIKVKNGRGVCKAASRATPQVCHRSAKAAIQGMRTAPSSQAACGHRRQPRVGTGDVADLGAS